MELQHQLFVLKASSGVKEYKTEGKYTEILNAQPEDCLTSLPLYSQNEEKKENVRLK